MATVLNYFEALDFGSRDDLYLLSVKLRNDLYDL